MRDIFRESFPEIERGIHTSDYFSANNGIEKVVTGNTYCVHHFEASWLSDIEKKHNKIRLAIQRRFGYGFVSKLIVFCVLASRMFAWRVKRQGLPRTILRYVKKMVKKP